LCDAANLFRSVPDWLRKYLDGSGRYAELLENLFAINVLRCAVDAKTG
jgi:hypothetical protein